MSSNFDEVFLLAIDQTMKEWKSFQLSVEQGMGGQYSNEKLVWMTQTIVELFKMNNNLDVEEVMDFVAEIIDNEFDTIIEDGSLHIFATNVCKYYRLCTSGRLQEVLDEIENIKQRNSNKVLVNNSLEQKDNEFEIEKQINSLNINSEEDMKTEESMEETDPQSDGWTRVQRKHRK